MQKFPFFWVISMKICSWKFLSCIFKIYLVHCTRYVLYNCVIVLKNLTEYIKDIYIYINSDVMKTIQCTHSPHHHNGFATTCRLWMATGISTPPLAVHSRRVATKPLWRWGGWAHWIVFMTCMYYALCFVHIEYSVCHEPISILINIYIYIYMYIYKDR